MVNVLVRLFATSSLTRLLVMLTLGARILWENCSLKVSLSVLLMITSLVFSFPAPQVHAASDFSISANSPGPGPIPAGNTTSSKILLLSNGFAGTLTLGMNSTAPFASLSRTSVILLAGGTNSSTLIVTPNNPGVYNINVTASSGSLSHSIIISITAAGEICLADQSVVASLAPGSNPCPASPYPFNGPFVTSPAPEQIRIGVYIWKSQPLNAFSISLRADHTVLTPTGANLTGSVLPGSSLIVGECIGGVAESPGQPCSSTDNSDTLHFAAAGFPSLSQNPTTGLLFTAIYNITGSTGPSGISLGFQTGCAESSTPNLCVVVANGNPLGPVTEVVQTSGSFSNDSPPPYVLISANPSSFSETDHSFKGTSAIKVSGVNGWPGSSVDLVRFSFQHSSGLNVTVSGTNPCAVASCSITLSLNSSIGGFQYVTVFANYDAKDPVTLKTSTLAAVVTVTVSGPDFSISANPSTVYFSPGTGNGSTTLTVASISGFAGPVQFSDSVSSSALTVSFTPSFISGGSGTSTAIFTSTALGPYQVNITASSSSLSHTLTVYVIVTGTVPDFSISTSPTAVFFATGSTGSSTVSVQSLQSFSGAVSLSATVSPASGLMVNFAPPAVTPAANGLAYSIVTFLSSTLGTYSVVITGMDGGNSHTATLTVTVSQQDFGLSISKASLGPISPDATDRSITVTIAPVGGFSGTVSLASKVSPSTGLAASLNPTSFAGAGTSTLVLTPSSSGTYSVNITATSGAITHFRLVTVTVSSAGPSGASPLFSSAVVYSIIAVAVIVGLAGVLLAIVRRRSRV